MVEETQAASLHRSISCIGYISGFYTSLRSYYLRPLRTVDTGQGDSLEVYCNNKWDHFPPIMSHSNVTAQLFSHQLNMLWFAQKYLSLTLKKVYFYQNIRFVPF